LPVHIIVIIIFGILVVLAYIRRTYCLQPLNVKLSTYLDMPFYVSYFSSVLMKEWLVTRKAVVL
jgi:hypothetical protein